MGELLNLVGLSTGVVLYAVLLAMVVRAGRTMGGPARVDLLLLVTSILGLVWNLCALPAYELPKVGFLGPFPFLVAVGFCALGFLPAVVVHSVLRGERLGIRGIPRRALASVAYGVSSTAAAFQLQSAWSGGPLPSLLGMRLLTYTFIALVVPLAAVTRGQPGARRALWAAALATFAVSALHLSQFHEGDPSWPVELVGHHASLPLAIAILYQDYPFALADLFLKRAMALLSVVTVAFIAIVALGGLSSEFNQFARDDPRQVGLLVTIWVATALIYPFLKRTTAWFVDAVVLHRPNYLSLRTRIARSVQAHQEVEPLLDELCGLVAPALSSRSVFWRKLHRTGVDHAVASLVVTGGRARALLRAGDENGDDDDENLTDDGALAAAVVVPAAEPPRYALAIGQLTGGRRLLSDDVATLEAIALVASRRIDTIRITRERYESERREQEITKLATEAELRALRAQVNPHFLFNALTTIGYLIQEAPPRALDTLMRLTALLRAVLRSEGEYTTLGRELEMIESYLDIERARFEKRLRVRIDVPSQLRDVRVPALLLQPIVENAVKHGIAPRQLGGRITVRASVRAVRGEPRQLVVVVEDTGAGSSDAALRRGREAGVGLRNIERRLACQYADAASLTIDTTPDRGTTVEIRLPIEAGASLTRTERSWTM